MNNNPLAGYFRRPAIYINLPSKGKFYNEDSIDIPKSGELPVYPMTALDEITYKTPDALFNGTAIVDVIKSCVPNILDPWEMPQDDLSAILSAIRIASFGHEMELDTTCPQCGEISTYGLDLREVLDSIKTPDYNESFDIGDLKVFFKPLTYKDINDNSKINLEEEQLMKYVQSKDMEDEEKIKHLSTAFKKVSNYTLATIVKNIDKIVTPDMAVDDSKFIMEFIRNCDRDIYNKIKENIIGKRASTDLAPVQIVCDNKKCKHKYNQPFTMDMSTFFG